MLAEESFLAPTFETEIGLFQHTTALGQRGNVVARIVDRIPDLFTTVTLVAAGVGIALVPQSCSCIQIPGVVYKPWSPQMHRVEMAAAFRRDERAPAVRAFIQQLEAVRASRAPANSRPDVRAPEQRLSVLSPVQCRVLARTRRSSRTGQCLELVETRTRFARREPFAFWPECEV
jgi:hypothetical protein